MSVNASLCLVLRLMSFGSRARIPFEFTPFDTLKILAGESCCARKFVSPAETAGDELADGDLRRTPANQPPVCRRSLRKLRGRVAPKRLIVKVHHFGIGAEEARVRILVKMDNVEAAQMNKLSEGQTGPAIFPRETARAHA